MDTSEQTTLETIKQMKRRRRSLEEKRRIVEETLEPGAYMLPQGAPRFPSIF
jgi:transposase-like protein